jgi:hypothetical protein
MKQEMQNTPGTSNRNMPGMGETVMFGDYEIRADRRQTGELLFKQDDLRKLILAMLELCERLDALKASFHD